MESKGKTTNSEVMNIEYEEHENKFGQEKAGWSRTTHIIFLALHIGVRRQLPSTTTTELCQSSLLYYYGRSVGRGMQSKK